MGLIDTKIEISISPANARHYKELGYIIPTHLDERNKERISIGSKILVHQKDLMDNSVEKVVVECDCCKKQYTLTNVNYRKHKDGLTYCASCYAKLFRSGIDNPNYNFNLTDEERNQGRVRNIVGYNNFVKKVLIRDNYTCQCCKNKLSEGLQVHHMDSYDWCVDKRVDDTNGITLCKKCHSNFHAHYGLGKNTKQQFEEWIGRTCQFIRFVGEIPYGRSVYCYETDQIYKDAKTASRELNILYRCVYDICNHKTRYSKNGYHLFWHEEYLKMSQDELDLFIEKNDKNNRVQYPVVCVEDNIYYASIRLASRHTKINNVSIANCCKGKSKHVTDKINNRKLTFKYYTDYLKTYDLTEEEVQKEKLLHFIF